MVLCDRCAGIDFGSLIERACIEAAEGPANSASLQPYTIVQDLSFAALRRDATQGCDLCSLIHDGLLDRVSTRPTSEQLADDALIVVSITLERCHLDFSPTAVQCSALWVICSNRDVELDEKWIGLPLESEGYSQYVSGKRYFWNPSLWCSWMNDCANTHDTCNAIKRNGYAPTRVIDVGSIDTAPKLVGSNETHAEYVALSHCWGESLPLRTTTANFRDHLNAIPWEALPATFQVLLKSRAQWGTSTCGLTAFASYGTAKKTGCVNVRSWAKFTRALR